MRWLGQCSRLHAAVIRAPLITRLRPYSSHPDQRGEGDLQGSIVGCKHVLEGNRVHVTSPSERIPGEGVEQVIRVVCTYGDDVRVICAATGKAMSRRGGEGKAANRSG